MSGAKLLEVIKMAGLQANNASKPVNIFVGRVVSVNPVEVEVEQINRIGKDFLVVCERLTDRFVYMAAVEDDFDDINDKEKYGIRKKYALYDGLKTGETVILARAAGGQKYFVIDRLEVVE